MIGRWNWLLCSLVLACTHLALAQSGAGGISGVVKDPSGALVPAAAVVARDVNTGVETAQWTTTSGATRECVEDAET